MSFQLLIDYCNGHKLLTLVLANMRYPLRNFKSIHDSTSSLILSRKINSNFIIDLVIHVCLEDFNDAVTPLSVKIYPHVNFKP